KLVALTARDLRTEAAKPSKGSEGLMYAFKLKGNGTGLLLQAATPLDKTRMPEERRILDSPVERANFPNLLSNYEVLGPSIKEGAPGCYNCIAWSVGISDKWVWPGNKLADFDQLYRTHGYERSPSMDYTLQ